MQIGQRVEKKHWFTRGCFNITLPTHSWDYAQIWQSGVFLRLPSCPRPKNRLFSSVLRSISFHYGIFLTTGGDTCHSSWLSTGNKYFGPSATWLCRHTQRSKKKKVKKRNLRKKGDREHAGDGSRAARFLV